MAFDRDLLNKYLEKRTDIDWYGNHQKSILGKFQLEIIRRCLQKYLPPEDHLILDVGIDPGIFAKEIAQLKRRLVIGDLSDELLRVTRDRFEALKLTAQIEQYSLIEDYNDLVQFKEDTFDMVIAMYGTLSYSCDNRYKMIRELVRVLKRGAPIVLSVKNRYHYLREIILKESHQKLAEPLKAGLWELLESGYKQYEEDEPAYYSFTSEEISELLSETDCDILEVKALNTLLTTNDPLEEIFENEQLWETAIELEEKLAFMPGLLDAGDEILIVARKRIL